MGLANNYVEVAGTVMDIYGYKVMNQGETYEKLEYKMKVKVDENQIFEVKFSAKISSKLYDGFCTLWDEIKTVAENGDEADRIKITGKLTNNTYYSKGKLYEGAEILVNSAKREKDTNKFDNNASFATLGYILEHNKLEDGTANVRALINEYSFNGNIKGHELVFNISEDVDDYLEFFPVKSVCSLEGMLNNERIEIELTEKDTEELSTEGTIGTAKKRILEENERRKKLREDGLFKDVCKLELIGGVNNISLDDIEENEYPFTENDIDDMLNGIDEKLEKSLEWDKNKNSSYYGDTDIGENVPF